MGEKKHFILTVMGIVLLGIAGILFAVSLNADPVVRLEVVESSLELKTGETIRLHAKGYTADGKEASAEKMEKLPIRWRIHAENVHMCTVDDLGNLTALSPGTVNVQAYCEKIDLYSRSITVRIGEE